LLVRDIEVTVSLEALTRQDVLAMARAAGLRLPDEDVDPLLDDLHAYGRHFAAIDSIDLDGVDPALTFDPRWDR
jgi:hypothetical protein